MPLLLLLLVGSIVHAVQHPHLAGFLLVFLIIAVVLASLKTRMYALRVQDRLIRLEERLRLSALLPPNLHPDMAALSISQLVALRFASDAELPSLAARAMSEALTPQQIKAAIVTWRADEFRV
jgi:Family of unknown function (DUF6526)